MITLKMKKFERVQIGMLIAVFMVLFGCSSPNSDRLPSTGRPFHLLKNAGDLEEGRQQYASALSNSKFPRYGTCWRTALDRLHTDCEALTDEIQARLALHFTNCFLDLSGRKTYICSSTDDMTSCARSMDATSFQAYTTFFTQAHNMCFFLKSQMWHEETEVMIVRLLDTSSHVSVQMSEQMELQKRSLENERRLLDRGHELNQAVQSSKAGVKQMLAEFQESTGEQRLFIAQMFDRVVTFHSLVIGEFAGVYSVIFFVVAIAVGYLLTSTRRTAGARLWIFCIIGANLAIEKLAITWQLQENVLKNSNEAQNIIYNRIWIVRKLSSYLALITLVVTAYRYKDFNVVNNELLKLITRQNTELSSRLNTIELNQSARTDTQSSLDEPLNTSSSCEDTHRRSSYERVNGKSTAENVVTAISNRLTSTPTKQKKIASRKSAIRNHEQVSPRESPYNLRNRKSVAMTNPIVEVEPPEKFAATIAQLAKISTANSLSMRKMLIESRTVRRAHFSSDEDDGH